MYIATETKSEYQIRKTDCRNRYTLADRLLNTHGYWKAIQICQNNQWAGVQKTINAIQSI